MPRLAFRGARELLGPPLKLDRGGLRFTDAERGVLDLENEACKRGARLALFDALEAERERKLRPRFGPLRLEARERRQVRFVAHQSPSARGRSCGEATT